MAKKTVIRIPLRRSLAPYLALRVSADRLFNQIEKSSAKEAIIDFSEVESMTRSFAHQYSIRKAKCPKSVREANVPASIELLMARSIEPVKIAAVPAKAIKPMRLML